MAEVLVEFPDVLTTRDGHSYTARACGGEMAGGRWHGWIEFMPTDGGEPLRSPRETTQPNRQDTIYWATGLTGVYLEGALDRALNPLVKTVAPPPPAPAFNGPAPNLAPPSTVTEGILNPFSVFRKGEALLRKQLGALSAWHLVNIITGYQLSAEDPAVLSQRPEEVLIETIVQAVRARGDEPLG